MSSEAPNAAYCFISNNATHCIPIHSFNSFSDSVEDGPRNEIRTGNDKLKILNKNLLYSLNNPSLSDLESDSPAPLSLLSRENSPTPEEEHEITSIINNYSTHAIYFPEFVIDTTEVFAGKFSSTQHLLSKIFPSWCNPDEIMVNFLTGGITNVLLSCTYKETGDKRLMRVYGLGTNLIIDRHREFISHLTLNSLGLAPPLYSRFKNGLIYGFFPGKSLESSDLKNENLYPLIAQQLGNWHKKIDYKMIDTGVETLRDFTVKSKKNNNIKVKHLKKKYISNIWELIKDWIDIVPLLPNLIASFDENLNIEISEENIRAKIIEEFNWLKEILLKADSPIVSSHCDLLSGNIIIPEDYSFDAPLKKLPDISKNPIRLIDYEYMLPAPRAFDIANHLMEWQGFDCDRSAIPIPSSDNPTIVRWVKGYLNDENASIEVINSLIEEISLFYGLPGFYWGIWATIQSEISNINFDYANYCKSRLQEYWEWKSNYLNSK